ncbi:hypothetical protein Sste5344_003726 [Sporothrix stenoceras]
MSPLIIGADVVTVNQSSVDIPTNSDIIATSHNALDATVSYIPGLSIEDQAQGNSTTDISIALASVPGLSSVTSNKKYTAMQVWSKKTVSRSSTNSFTGVEAGQTNVLLFSEE